MKTINIQIINFETGVEASENKNYPISGLFLVRTEEGMSDLRIVDKTVKHNFCIVPESIFNSIFGSVTENNTAQLESVSPTENKYDGDFILEFSRILLNRK